MRCKEKKEKKIGELKLPLQGGNLTPINTTGTEK